jgi:hypothetical protein
MIKAVFVWRCKCGIRIKVVGETSKSDPTAKAVVKCPECGDEQIIAASKVVSVTQDKDEIFRT